MNRFVKKKEKLHFYVDLRYSALFQRGNSCFNCADKSEVVNREGRRKFEQLRDR